MERTVCRDSMHLDNQFWDWASKKGLTDRFFKSERQNYQLENIFLAKMGVMCETFTDTYFVYLLFILLTILILCKFQKSRSRSFRPTFGSTQRWQYTEQTDKILSKILLWAQGTSTRMFPQNRRKRQHRAFHHSTYPVEYEKAIALWYRSRQINKRVDKLIVCKRSSIFHTNYVSKGTRKSFRERRTGRLETKDFEEPIVGTMAPLTEPEQLKTNREASGHS